MIYPRPVSCRRDFSFWNKKTRVRSAPFRGGKLCETRGSNAHRVERGSVVGLGGLGEGLGVVAGGLVAGDGLDLPALVVPTDQDQVAVGVAGGGDAGDHDLLALEGPAVDDLEVGVEDGHLTVGDDGEGVAKAGVGADQVAVLVDFDGLELVAIGDDFVELLGVEERIDQVVGGDDGDVVVAQDAVVLVGRELDAGESQVGEAPVAVHVLGQDQGVPAAVELLTLVDDADRRGGELLGAGAVHVGLDGLAEAGRLEAVHPAGRLEADHVDALGAEIGGDELEGDLDGVHQLDLAVLAGAVLGAELHRLEVLVEGHALDGVGGHAVVGLAVVVAGGSRKPGGSGSGSGSLELLSFGVSLGVFFDCLSDGIPVGANRSRCHSTERTSERVSEGENCVK